MRLCGFAVLYIFISLFRTFSRETAIVAFPAVFTKMRALLRQRGRKCDGTKTIVGARPAACQIKFWVYETKTHLKGVVSCRSDFVVGV